MSSAGQKPRGAAVLTGHMMGVAEALQGQKNDWPANECGGRTGGYKRPAIPGGGPVGEGVGQQQQAATCQGAPQQSFSQASGPQKPCQYWCSQPHRSEERRVGKECSSRW